MPWKNDEYKIFQSKINELIKNKRIAKGLSFGKAAKLVGVKRSSYQMYESRTLPPINMLIKLMDALDFTYEDVKKIYDETQEELSGK